MRFTVYVELYIYFEYGANKLKTLQLLPIIEVWGLGLQHFKKRETTDWVSPVSNPTRLLTGEDAINHDHGEKEVFQSYHHGWDCETRE